MENEEIKERKFDNSIQDEISILNSKHLLDALLVDKTTKHNIVWGTDEYSQLGEDFYERKEIFPSLISGDNKEVIKNRTNKDSKLKFERVKEHAEVFTPIFICNKMIDYIDSVWFGSECVFDSNISPIIFPGDLKWQDYVLSRRLEIACGEAPFLVNRYETNTGELIEINDRKGILDRKLRVINENVSSEKEWLTWVYKAFQSTYGYEFQGDNLLIARLNLLLTFEEYLLFRWNRKPRKNEYNKIIDIICWNIWQMDGLTEAIPFCDISGDFQQISLFEDKIDDDFLQHKCLICEWNHKKMIKFSDLVKGDYKKMKFDYVVGNPPYQKDVAINETQNNQRRSKSIFQYFQIQVDKITKKSSILIYPGDRWIHRSGKGMEDFGYRQINDVCLTRLDYYPDQSEVFYGVDIPSGISIVCKKYDKKEGGFEYRYIKNGTEKIIQQDNPGKDLMLLNPDDISIMSHVKDFVNSHNLSYLSDFILPQKLFGIESDFVENNPEKVRPLEENSSFDPKTEVKLLTNDQGRQAGRSKWFITKKDYIKTNKKYIDEWQVVVSSASPGGQKRDYKIGIIDNHSAFGRVRVALRSFKTEKEAQNFYKYATSYVIRFTLLMTDEALTTLGRKVPDILDYTDDNSILDFSEDIDRQLFELLNLNNDEINYIKNRIDSLR